MKPETIQTGNPQQKKILWLKKENKQLAPQGTAIQINNVVPTINPIIAKKVAERLTSGDRRKKHLSPTAGDRNKASKPNKQVQYTLVRQAHYY